MKTLFIALTFTLLLIGVAAQPYSQLPGYGYRVDCVDAPCDGRTCLGNQINPGIDEGSISGGCYNSFDDNCNNDAGAWDADPQTGADCGEPACAGKQGPAGKTCCRSDNDCRSIAPGNCGQAYCDTASNTCETRIASDQNTACQRLVQEQSLECAAVPSDTACRQIAGFPYTTYSCDLRPVNQRCTNAASCSAENGRDCACDPSTFRCSVNRCTQADQLRQQTPSSLLYCYSQCQQLQYTTVTGEALDGRQCVFNELFNLNNNCT